MQWIDTTFRERITRQVQNIADSIYSLSLPRQRRVLCGLNLKTAVQATENTEIKRISHLLEARLIGEAGIYGKQLFCELGDESPIPANPITSVNSVFSVAN